jgi:hypothetical protein
MDTGRVVDWSPKFAVAQQVGPPSAPTRCEDDGKSEYSGRTAIPGQHHIHLT